MTDLPKPPTIVAVILIVMIPAAASVGVSAAAEAPPPAAPHVRAEAPEVRQLIRELIDGSATARGLKERLERSDVVVYVRFQTFQTNELDGRVALVAAVLRYRYLVIELAFGRSRLAQMTTLAHELHHAVEIADAPAIVDGQSLSAHYSRIGTRTSIGPSEMFETVAARETAADARRELLGGARTTRTTHERD